ncbi:MAG TPA: glycosyltransferase family 2 protein [Chitinophagaceae bacterium]|jgi:glycosyltransferase involved in cell wall biosynthesis|nr:glycosyltransferase family 2 protein [Chitinophagaceae bacterium]
MLDIYRSGNPCVSVIMATYNRANYLDRSIPSFINQTYKNCELLVVDDGSEDDTFQKVSSYMDNHDNIRYLKHTNRKLSLTKNAGIKAAIGKFIAFLDSDDEYKPDYLEKRIQFMEANESVDLIEGGALIIGDPYVKNKYDMTKKIHLSECPIGPTIFGKAEAFAKLEGFDKNIFYSEDSYFWEKAQKILNVKKFDHLSYIYYRDTPGSICNTV